jgi:hypothetical protein
MNPILWCLFIYLFVCFVSSFFFLLVNYNENKKEKRKEKEMVEMYINHEDSEIFCEKDIEVLLLLSRKSHSRQNIIVISQLRNRGKIIFKAVHSASNLIAL